MECKNCYAEMEVREDKPSLQICLQCAETPDHLGDWHCPECGWDSQNELGNEDSPVVYSDFRQHWEHPNAEDWEETWTCKDCGHVWSYRNASY